MLQSRAWKEKPSHWQPTYMPLTRACSLYPISRTISQLESLKFLPYLQHLDGASIHSTWDDYDKAISWNLKLSYGVESSSSRFVSPKSMGFQAFFGLSWMLHWLLMNASIILPWAISHFEQYDRFTLAQIILSLTIDQASNILSLNWMESRQLKALINPFEHCKFKLSTRALV